MNLLDHYAGIMITVTNTLFNVHSSGRKVLIETHKGRNISVTPRNFKAVLSKFYPDENPQELLTAFRKLGFIVTDKSGRCNTNVIYRSGKSIRVVTFSREFVEFLKACFEQDHRPKR